MEAEEGDHIGRIAMGALLGVGHGRFHAGARGVGEREVPAARIEDRHLNAVEVHRTSSPFAELSDLPDLHELAHAEIVGRGGGECQSHAGIMD